MLHTHKKNIGLAKKFIWVFHTSLQRNLNEFAAQGPDYANISHELKAYFHCRIIRQYSFVKNYFPSLMSSIKS